MSGHLFEVAMLPLVPLQHVHNDGQGDLPYFFLRHQGQLEERAHKVRDEVGPELAQRVPQAFHLDAHQYPHVLVSVMEK